LKPLSPRGSRGARTQLVRAGVTTAFALALLAFFATGSTAVAGIMFLVGAACVAAVLLWVRGQERKATAIPEGALWSGPVTVRVRDMLESPLLDTVSVRRAAEALAWRRPARGAIGDVVVDELSVTWTARWDAGLAGVHGSFTLPWTAVVRAQAAAIPAATPGSGAVALTFADSKKLDMAFAGNYPGFRATLTRLPRPLPGLGD
jgi:hypothetical protein